MTFGSARSAELAASGSASKTSRAASSCPSARTASRGARGDQLGPGGADEQRARLHRPEQRLVEHAPGVVGERQVQGDDITRRRAAGAPPEAGAHISVQFSFGAAKEPGFGYSLAYHRRGRQA